MCYNWNILAVSLVYVVWMIEAYKTSKHINLIC